MLRTFTYDKLVVASHEEVLSHTRSYVVPCWYYGTYIIFNLDCTCACVSLRLRTRNNIVRVCVIRLHVRIINIDILF